MPRSNPANLALEQIAEALAPFAVELSEQQLTSIQSYVSLLLTWNQSVSLTAVKEPLEIVARHFGESMFAGTFLQFRSGRLADVGTGAGFPGLALRIAFPGLSAVLLEPNLKKCAFLNEVKRALNLDRVEIKRARFEECREREFDFVCCRALGEHRQFLQWARAAVAVEGRVVLWLGAEDAVRIARTSGWIWDAPVRIPESRRRVVLCGRPDL
jgi:16S rRNA (guanine527-N7)-methyltransferase